MQISSLRCWKEIQKSGLLSDMRKATYVALVEYGPGTAMEVFNRCQFSDTMMLYMTKNNFCSRLSELRIQGIAEVAGDLRTCTKKNRGGFIWTALDKMPIKLVRPKVQTCRERLALAMVVNAELRAANTNLTQRCATIEIKLHALVAKEASQIDLFASR